MNSHETDNEDRKKYPRARKPWASIELQRLRLLLPYEYTKEELVNFFGRPPANIAATIKEFETVIASWPELDREKIMFRPPLPSFGEYDFNAKFQDLFPEISVTPPQAQPTRAAEPPVPHSPSSANGPVSADAHESVADEGHVKAAQEHEKKGVQEMTDNRHPTPKKAKG